MIDWIERGQFDQYHDRLSSVVPTPETEILNLDSSKREQWSTEDIQSVMEENDWNRAFVRTMQKAAPDGIDRGSIIHEPTESEIDRTLSSLLTQIRMSEWSSGGAIAVRELLDTRFCLGGKHHMCHPEIRYFIEGGEVLFKTPEKPLVNCSQQYDYLQEVVQSAEAPDHLAEKVADEFDRLTWAVDFVMETNGDWYCPEMNLNGVRWDGKMNRWINMCGYGDKKHLSPEVVHSAVLRRIDD